MKKILFTGLLAISLTGCLQHPTQHNSGTDSMAQESMMVGIGMNNLVGTAYYRERIRLPENTEMEVTVYGKDGETLAQHREPAPAGPPYSFSSMVPNAAIEHPLSVKVRLLIDEKVRFSSDRVPFNRNQPLQILLTAPR